MAERQGGQVPVAPLRQGGLTSVQELARQIVDELGSQDVAEYLERRIAEVTDVSLKGALIDAYTRLKGPEATTLLTQLVDDRSELEEVRGFAFRCLAKTGTTVGTNVVLTGFVDPDPRTRRMAVEAASCLDSNRVIDLESMRVIELLKEALEDSDCRVQAAAASALMSLDAREASALLRQYIERNPISPEAERARRFLTAGELATVFSNTPPLPKRVAWRDSYIADIVRDIEITRRRIVLIVGPGGCGKSIVANLAARAIEAEFKLWIDADICRDKNFAITITSLVRESIGDKRTGPEHLSTADDYTEYLIDIIETDGRRFLFILDGLDEVDSVRYTPLTIKLLETIVERIPSATVLITSRPISRALAPYVTNARFAPSPLSMSETEAFVRSMLPEFSGFHIRRLAEMSKGNVLILQLLAVRLEGLKGYSPSDVENMLAYNESQSLWSEGVGRLIDSVDSSSIIALQIVALSGGRYQLDVTDGPRFASEGISDATKVFKRLESLGLVEFSGGWIGLSNAAFRAPIVASVAVHDLERLADKFPELYSYRNSDGTIIFHRSQEQIERDTRMPWHDVDDYEQLYGEY
jgi:hypothetical protein